ncbi:MAG: hypothetical protein ACXV7G_12020 [Halobacteriota archaeon]
MKRTLVIAILCMLLLSTVGAVAAVAKDNQPAGKSSIWQYNIQIDPVGHGKLVLNTKTQTFTFAGEGCTVGTTYYLYYTDASGKRVDLGPPAVADELGKLFVAGSYNPADINQVKQAVVTTEAPYQAVIRVIPVGPTSWQIDVSSSTGPIDHISLVQVGKAPDGTTRDTFNVYSTWQNALTMLPQITFSEPTNTQVTATLTTYDTNNNPLAETTTTWTLPFN